MCFRRKEASGAELRFRLNLQVQLNYGNQLATGDRPTATDAPGSPQLRRDHWRCTSRHFSVCAIFAPWVAPSDPAHIDLPNRLEPPSRTHWCGTDELGRDILSRLIYGSRISMSVGASVVILSLLLGLIVGSLAGYYGGGIDRFVNIVVMNAFLSFPGILIAIAFVALSGPRNFQSGSGAVSWRMGWLCAAGARPGAGHPRKRICGSGARAWGDRLAGDYAPYFAEHNSTRYRTGRYRHGRSDPGRSDHEFSWAGCSPADRQLGFDAERWALTLVRLPHLVLFPAVTVMLAVLAFNFIGDALRDVLDPRSRIEAGL